MKCIFCKGKEFKDFVDFRGSTEETKKNTYTYARCKKCGSIINTSGKEVNYKNYTSGKKNFLGRLFRFKSYLYAREIFYDSKILDYGCGSGVIFKSLKEGGYKNIYGYEPNNQKFKHTLKNNRKYDVVYLIHTFEHIIDLNKFFKDINRRTEPNAKVITIHPSSSRIKKLDPKDSLHCWTIHAPFHNSIPSDKATINIFKRNGFDLILRSPMDVQRSGFFENNKVSALLRKKLGGTKESLIEASNIKKLFTYAKNPFMFFNKMVIDIVDETVSTFIFEKRTVA